MSLDAKELKAIAEQAKVRIASELCQIVTNEIKAAAEQGALEYRFHCPRQALKDCMPKIITQIGLDCSIEENHYVFKWD